MDFFETKRLNSGLNVGIRISEIASFSENRDGSCIIRMRDREWYLVSAPWSEVNRVVRGLGTTTDGRQPGNLDDIPF